MNDKKNISEILICIQQELKAPKGQFNSFGKYKYRSCEDILEALKPLLKKYEARLTLSDEVIMLGDRFYIKATATLYGDGSAITNTAFAREDSDKKGMDGSQITGTASSYARKYCLNGLFLIDDTKDSDTDEYRNTQERAKEKESQEQAEQEKLKEKISERHVKSIKLTIEKNPETINEKGICEHYGVAKLEDMTMENYMDFVRMVSGGKKK